MAKKNREEVSFTITGEDLISRVFREIGKNAEQMEVIVKSAGRKMDSALEEATQESKKLSSEMKGLGREVDQASRKFDRLKVAARGIDQTITRFNAAMAGVNRWAGRAILGTGTTLAMTTAAIAGTSINKNISFERQHAYTSTAIRSNYQDEATYRADADKLKLQAKMLGSDPKNFFSALEISQAQEALAKAGYADESGVEGLLKAIPDFLDFALYHRMDTGEAAEFGADMVQMFKYQKDQAGQLLDMLTKTADISTLDISDIRESMTYAGAIGSIQGRDPAEILATLATLGYALKGSVSGTGIAAVYSDLLNLNISDQAEQNAPSSRVANVARGLKSKLVKDGQALPFVEQVKVLQEEFGKLNQQEQDWLAKTISGEEHKKTLLALIDQGYEKIAENMRIIKEQSAGINHQLTENLLESSAGDLNLITKTIAEIQQELGDGLSPMFGEVARQIRIVAEGGSVDFNALRDSIDESYQKLKQTNVGLAETAKWLMEIGTNTAEIGVAVSPVFSGLGEGLVKLFNGDVSGAVSALAEGIEKANLNIDKLPDELQSLATAAKNATLFLAGLAGLSLAGKAYKVGKEAWTTGKAIYDKLTGNSKTITEVLTKTGIHASVVNVYGKVVNASGSEGGLIVDGNSKNDKQPGKKPKNRGKGLFGVLTSMLAIDLANDALNDNYSSLDKETNNRSDPLTDTFALPWWLTWNWQTLVASALTPPIVKGMTTPRIPNMGENLVDARIGSTMLENLYGSDYMNKILTGGKQEAEKIFNNQINIDSEAKSALLDHLNKAGTGINSYSNAVTQTIVLKQEPTKIQVEFVGDAKNMFNVKEIEKPSGNGIVRIMQIMNRRIGLE